MIIASLTVNDRFGGLVACQGKGKSTSSEHCEQMKKAIDVNVRFRIKVT